MFGLCSRLLCIINANTQCGRITNPPEQGRRGDRNYKLPPNTPLAPASNTQKSTRQQVNKSTKGVFEIFMMADR